MAEILIKYWLQIKVAKEWRSLEELLDMPVLGDLLSVDGM